MVSPAQMPREPAGLQRWIIDLYGRRGYHETLVEIANKHARIVWAVMTKGARFDASIATVKPRAVAAAA